MKNKKIYAIEAATIILGTIFISSISAQNIETISTEINKTTISSNTIIVDDEGDGDFTSIREAINKAINGDKIEVYSGTYIESIIVDKKLTLHGIDSELGKGNDIGKPIVKRGEDEAVFTLTADGCDMSGFDLRCSGFTLDGIKLCSDHNNVNGNIVEGNFGIHLHQSSQNEIFENDIRKCNMAILADYESNHNQIYENYMTGNTYGIKLHYHSDYNLVYNNCIAHAHANGIGELLSNNNTIFENIIMNCDIGIELKAEEGPGYYYTIYGNNISNCVTAGIEIGSKFNTIFRNNITNCEYGIRLKTIETIIPKYCCVNDVYENNIKNNEKAGIFLRMAYSNDIYRNNLSGNGKCGLYLHYSELNNIFENNITCNNDGIHLWDCEQNQIYHNNFINNSRNGFCGSGWNKWHYGDKNNGSGNYWSDYTGLDINNDCIGDTKYIIPDLDDCPKNNNKDEYPLMKPYGKQISVSKFHNKSINIYVGRSMVMHQLFQRVLHIFAKMLKLSQLTINS